MLKKISLFLVIVTALSLSPNNLLSGFVPSELLAPVEVSAQMSMNQMTDRNIVEVASGSYNAYAIDDDGNLWSWGQKDSRLGREHSLLDKEKDAGLVTAPGMKRIKQVSASDGLALALDTDGKVWSWGLDELGAIGRDVPALSGSNKLPGQVEFLDEKNIGATIVKIAASGRGGRAVDTKGRLWVWGTVLDGPLYGNGAGDLVGQLTARPKLLKDSATGSGPTERIPNGLDDVKFVDVATADYLDLACTILLDSQGNVWTYGLGDLTNLGGSRWPKKVNHNWQGNVKKIEAGASLLMVLTDTGKVWTWGDKIHGQLGRAGDSSPVPQLTEMNQGAFAVDASVYWHSISVLDEKGNIYVAGLNDNSHHEGKALGYNRSAKQTIKYGVLSTFDYYIIFPHSNAKSKPVRVSEGARVSSWFDEYGNLYAIATTTLYGLHGGATNNEPWVHFKGDGAPRITSIKANPANTQHNYSKPIGASVDVKLDSSATTVQYVVLRQTDDDAGLYHDKTFYEIGDPFLLLDKNKNPWQSDSSGPLFVSQFGKNNPNYAHPGITRALFNEVYAKRQAAGRDSGVMDGGGASWTKSNMITSNCVVWIQATNSSGSHRMVEIFENYYDQTEATVSGFYKIASNAVYNIFENKPLPGQYGFVKNSDGSWYNGVPPLGFDLIKPTLNAVSSYLKVSDDNNKMYWRIKDENTQFAEEAEADPTVGRATTGSDSDKNVTLKHRADRSKELFINGGDMTSGQNISLEFEKEPSSWADVTIHYVSQSDFGDVSVYKNGSNNADGLITEETISNFAAIGTDELNFLREPYTTKKASPEGKLPVGYIVSKNRPANTRDIVNEQFPNGFNPVDADTNVWVVYGAQYNIEYELNGGTNPQDAPQKYSAGLGVQLPVPTKDNFIFGGWHLSESFSENGLSAISETDFGDKTLYAKWLSNTRVYFDRVSGNKGDIIKVPLKLSANIIQIGYTDTEYDSNILEFKGVETGPGFENVDYEVYNDDGIIGIDWYGENDAEDDAAFYLSFEVLSSATTTTKLHISWSIFYTNVDYDNGDGFDEVYPATEDGTIDINAMDFITTFEQNGKVITSNFETNNGALVIKSNITNRSGSDKHVDLIIALYDADNKLLGVLPKTVGVYDENKKEYVIKDQANVSERFELIVSDDTLKKVKVFYWNGTDVMTPYTAASEIFR